jgi:osmotically-inducible protein OsmY
MQKISIAAAVIAATMLSACADMKVTPNPMVSDTRIATAEGSMADAVRWELGMKGIRGLTVSVKDGEVTLKGSVATGRELAEAAKTAQAVPGVRAVIPDVDVKG